MNEYHFNTEVAQRYGVNEAIFLHSLAFWVEKNRANDRNCYEGRYWSYNTQKALAELFPFWTRRQIERIISSCKEQGALLAGCFNEDKTDRTKWYTLGDEAEEIYFKTKTVQCISPDGGMAVPQRVDRSEETGAPIAPIGEMHITEPGHPFYQTGECNKDTVVYPVNDIPPISPQKKRRGTGLPAEVSQLLSDYMRDKPPELGEALESFMEVRDKRKAVNTVRPVKTLLSELERLSGGNDALRLALVKTAVLNGWKSVYPLKESGAPPVGSAKMEEGAWI